MPLEMYSDSPLSKVKSIIAIAAGKGGVGKSTVCVNLASALNRSGLKVGIIDTDIYGPSVRKMLKEDQLPFQKNNLLFPAICGGIKVISMAFFRKENEASVVRAPMANKMIAQFIQNVQWGELDVLLLDFPPGTGDIQLTLSQQLNLTGAILVTTPQEVAVLDVKKALTMFELVKIPVIGVVENMSYFQNGNEKNYLFGKGGGEKLACENGLPFISQIPIDPLLSECGDKGLSIFQMDKNLEKPVSQSFLEIERFLRVYLENHTNKADNFEMAWRDMS